MASLLVNIMASEEDRACLELEMRYRASTIRQYRCCGTILRLPDSLEFEI